MDSNEEAVAKSNDVISQIVSSLEELVMVVDNGDCNDPGTNLFDADAFWVSFSELVKPFVKSVIDNQKMD